MVRRGGMLARAAAAVTAGALATLEAIAVSPHASTPTAATVSADTWQDVVLAAPLTTLIEAPRAAADGGVEAELLVPADAPGDLHLSAYSIDAHGRWWQRDLGQLRPGRTHVRVDFDAQPPRAVGHGAVWHAGESALRPRRVGLALSSPLPGRLRIRGLTAIVAAPRATTAAGQHSLRELGATPSRLRAGERWEATLMPEPAPANPFDPAQFALDLVVSGPDGEHRIPGFWTMPMSSEDRGDREAVSPAGAGRMAVRYRPRHAGVHRLRLEASWAGAAARVVELPPLEVEGPDTDPFTRVDAGDPRFLAVDGRWWWPIGPNLRSVSDVRSQERMGTRLTAPRGTLAYAASLPRLAALGCDAVEVWMSSWNLALEWRADWAPYRGLGRYSEENAWRLERVLDDAWANGMRVNLVIANHGQASEKTDPEWAQSPWNRAHGGPLTRASEMFTAPAALAGQERLRRYIVGRYGDHPAVMAWKLWSEMNLTDAGDVGTLRAWHEHAAARWRALDPYDRPVASHWSQDYTCVAPEVAGLLDLVCIDAYFGYWSPRTIADLMERTLHDPHRGLAALRRAVLVTEFGGDWNGAPGDGAMLVDHLSGPWAALVSGHAGAPMLWWFEWLDQRAKAHPYAGLRAFIAGEDLRGGASLPVVAASPTWWARAWCANGRTLGYAMHRGWAMGETGWRRPTEATPGLTVRLPAASGERRVEWWDPLAGTLLHVDRCHAVDGEVRLPPSPPSKGQVAFKILPP